MRQALLLSVASVCFVLTGCQQSAVTAVKDMRARACAADPSGFFAFVDRTAITEVYKQRARNVGEEAASKLNPIQAAAYRQGFESRIGGIQNVVQEMFTQWEDDIKRGDASNLCRMSVIDAHEVENSADVHVRTPSGKDRSWRLSRFGRRWLLVDVSEVRKKDTATE